MLGGCGLVGLRPVGLAVGSLRGFSTEYELVQGWLQVGMGNVCGGLRVVG